MTLEDDGNLQAFEHAGVIGVIESMYPCGYFIIWNGMGAHYTSIADDAPIHDTIDPIIKAWEASK